MRLIHDACGNEMEPLPVLGESTGQCWHCSCQAVGRWVDGEPTETPAPVPSTPRPAKGNGHGDMSQVVARHVATANPLTLEPQSARALMAKTFPDLKWLAQDIICEGSLTVLAGKAKVGKSWACLQLACAVASGTPFLDKTTAKSKVLYCALEDSERRVQRRLLKQGHAVPEGLDFLYKIPVVSDMDGVSALQLLITTYHYNMLILDTWAAAMGRQVDEDDSNDMAPIYNNLRDVAQVTGCALVVISHHGKVVNADAVYDVRGSSAIGAAADTIIGLYKKRGETRAVFSVVSRDIEDSDLSLTFSKETCTWACLGDAKDIAQSENEQRTLDTLKTYGEADATTIARELDMTRQGVSEILKTLAERGLVTWKQVNLKQGGRNVVYALAGASK